MIPSEKNTVFNAVNGLKSGFASVANSSGNLEELKGAIFISLVLVEFSLNLLK